MFICYVFMSSYKLSYKDRSNVVEGDEPPTYCIDNKTRGV